MAIQPSITRQISTTSDDQVVVLPVPPLVPFSGRARRTEAVGPTTLRFTTTRARALRVVTRLARVAAERHGLVASRARLRSLTESHTHLVARVWLIGGALIVVTMIGVGLNIVDMRARTMEEKRDDITGLGAVLAEQTYRYIQVIDLVLRDVQAHTQDMGIRTQEGFRVRLGGPDTHEYLKNRLKNLLQAHSIRLSLVPTSGSMVN